MRPHVICHMLSSVDGRIDGAALRSVIDGSDYETIGGELDGDAWICGRTTMHQHFAGDGPFAPASTAPAGAQPPFVARRAESYAISVDTLGKLNWSGGDLDGVHLICVVSELAAANYLAMLREKAISYVVSGREAVDLAGALDQLGEHFGIRMLLLEGGGHINGAFLDAGLVDEVSLLLAPGIDGRSDVPAVFDGLTDAERPAVPLRLKSVDRRERDLLWIRYEVIRHGAV